MGSKRPLGAEFPIILTTKSAKPSLSDRGSNASSTGHLNAEVGTSRTAASTSSPRGAVAVSSSSPTPASTPLNSGVPSAAIRVAAGRGSVLSPTLTQGRQRGQPVPIPIPIPSRSFVCPYSQVLAPKRPSSSTTCRENADEFRITPQNDLDLNSGSIASKRSVRQILPAFETQQVTQQGAVFDQPSRNIISSENGGGTRGAGQTTTKSRSGSTRVTQETQPTRLVSLLVEKPQTPVPMQPKATVPDRPLYETIYPGYPGSHVHRSPLQADVMLAVTSVLDSLPNKISDVLSPKFDSLHASISSINDELSSLTTSATTIQASLTQVRDEMADFKEDVKNDIEAHYAGHAEILELLSGLKEKVTNLERNVGESGSEGEKNTLMGTLEGVCAALKSAIEKLPDPHTNDVLNEDVEMINDTQPDPGPSTSLGSSLTLSSTDISGLRPTPPSTSSDVNCNASSILVQPHKIMSELSGFTKVDWNQADRQPSITSTSDRSSLLCPSCVDGSRLALPPTKLATVTTSSTPSTGSLETPSTHIYQRLPEAHEEVQQLPSPLEMPPPLSRAASQPAVIGNPSSTTGTLEPPLSQVPTPPTPFEAEGSQIPTPEDVQAGLATPKNHSKTREVEPSPAMSTRSLLPDLGYPAPTREGTTVPSDEEEEQNETEMGDESESEEQKEQAEIVTVAGRKDTREAKEEEVRGLILKKKEPLFLPELTATPAPESIVTSPQFSRSPMTAARALLKRPLDNTRSLSPVAYSSAQGTPEATFAHTSTNISTLSKFSPPVTPEPIHPPSDEPALEYASRVPSPALPNPSATEVRRRTLVSSQALPSSYDLVRSPSQELPESSSPHSPIHLSGEPSPQKDSVNPQETGRVANLVSFSDDSEKDIIVQLTTLSEPESFDESEDEDENEDDEDEVEVELDELLPSQSPWPEDVANPQASFRTVTNESSLKTFTPSVTTEADSIQSFGESYTAAATDAIVVDRDEAGIEVEMHGDPELEQLHLEEGGTFQSQFEVEAELGPEPEAEAQSPSQPQETGLDNDSEPQYESVLLPEEYQEDNDILMPPVVVQPNPQKTQERALVTPIPLPTYVSPVNTPSPSPIRSGGITSRVRTIGLGKGRGRKRKLDEMRASPVLVVETQVEDRDVFGPTEGQKVSDRAAAAASSSVTRSVASSIPKSRTGILEKAPTEVMNNGKQARTQEKTMKVSGRPKPRMVHVQEVTCIDLTDSPPQKSTPLPSTKEPTQKTRTPDACSPAIDHPHPPPTLPNSRNRAKEPRRGEQRRQGEEQETRENERKRKAEEKKKMPVGADAEDSDDAEIRPASKLKRPKPSMDMNLPGDEDVAADSVVFVPPTQTTRTVDLNEIRSKQAANLKESKALTKVKRRPRQTNGGTENTGPTSTQRSRATNGVEEPPLKRARNRHPEDGDTTASQGTLLQRRKQPKKSLLSPSEVNQSSAKGKEIEGALERSAKTKPRRKSGDVVDLTFDPPTSPIRTKWPVKRDGQLHEKNFIECDSCHTWYHNGCVGIKADDLRLKDTEIFACPPCEAGRVEALPNIPEKSCGRPDCTYMGAKGDYFVKRIIGRKAKIEGGRGRVEEYLVEWDGYPIGESTWEKETFINDPSQLVHDFVDAAEKEGLDLDSDPFKCVLLSDATMAGWREYEYEIE